MKLLTWCKKQRNKPVQLTTAGIIISSIHEPLQLSIANLNHVRIAMTLSVIITIGGATIQNCSGAWVLLSSVVQACSCPFSTRSAISSNFSL